MKSYAQLLAQINADITTNGTGAITGAKLKAILQEAAAAGSVGAFPCDPTLVSGDVGLILGIDPADGLAKTYAEEPVVAGAKGRWTLDFTALSKNPAGQKARIEDITIAAGAADNDTLVVDLSGAGYGSITFTFKNAPTTPLHIQTDGTVTTQRGLIAEALNRVFGAVLRAVNVSTNKITVQFFAVGADANGDTLTFTTGIASADVWTFDEGEDPLDEIVTLKAKGTTTEIQSDAWVDFASDGYNPHTTPTQEATAFKSYIDGNASLGFTASRVGAVVTLDLTDFYYISSVPNITTDLTNITRAETIAPVRSQVKQARWICLGRLAGVETVSGQKYALFSNALIEDVTIKANNPIVLSEYSIGDENMHKAILCGADGGMLRSVTLVDGLVAGGSFDGNLAQVTYDALGVCYLALQEAANSGSPQTIKALRLRIGII